MCNKNIIAQAHFDIQQAIKGQAYGEFQFKQVNVSHLAYNLHMKALLQLGVCTKFIQSPLNQHDDLYS